MAAHHGAVDVSSMFSAPLHDSVLARKRLFSNASSKQPPSLQGPAIDDDLRSLDIESALNIPTPLTTAALRDFNMSQSPKVSSRRKRSSTAQPTMEKYMTADPTEDLSFTPSPLSFPLRRYATSNAVASRSQRTTASTEDLPFSPPPIRRYATSTAVPKILDTFDDPLLPPSYQPLTPPLIPFAGDNLLEMEKGKDSAPANPPSPSPRRHNERPDPAGAGNPRNPGRGRRRAAERAVRRFRELEEGEGEGEGEPGLGPGSDACFGYILLYKTVLPQLRALGGHILHLDLRNAPRLRRETGLGPRRAIDIQEVVVIALAGFFTLFTVPLFCTHTWMICLNQLTVESFRLRGMKEA
ncbi:hypothetical protein FIBSPDRAFT_970317 [Athelia psychrophila]|uniref:Uncharacterized protein n=1 Tax=Athelia psychrophila TaxID=1759441 RepID=A0A167SRX9_9AGAM|nr:hypothetical protein FIBSPDRAFT_970317 [Fibularhizoctonia sp. CBS 109695]